MKIYLSDLREEVYAEIENQIRKERPDLVEAMDNADTIVIADPEINNFKTL